MKTTRPKMTPTITWKHYLLSVFMLLVLDFLWIGLYFQYPYAELVKKVQQGAEMEARVGFALLAYTEMIIALLVLVMPRIDLTSTATIFKTSFFNGGILGFCMYGVYASTAAAIFKDFDGLVAMQDTIWGTIVYTLTPFLSCWLLGLCGMNGDGTDQLQKSY